MKSSSLLALFLMIAVGSSAVRAQTPIQIAGDISISITLTSDNYYELVGNVKILPGASITIEAGTVVASTGSSSLVITKGAQIFCLGTKTNPVILTSGVDLTTWSSDPSHPTGADPKTGTWRESALEWGNLTIMGAGYISENATAGNVPTCNANNVATMEGLVASGPGDPTVLYGGGDDDDDSGIINYTSIRYGGLVVGLNVELNGLSLGGIGRETDIEGIEIMNNVDDGIEIWGGAVNIRNFSIWNVGDDSFDVDQGWRGKAQFGLIVQGWSLDTNQGGGVGDNCFETDGAENSDWQPVTTTAIYNATVIGQPLDGDHATAWRDNARVQYRNCIFTDIGDDLVHFDNVDGDGAQGYGFNGTLAWASTWSTPYNAVPAHANDCTQPDVYTVQTSGFLAEMRDCVFFNAGDTTEATARGVFGAGFNNVTAAVSPIKSLTRGPTVVKGGKFMQQVVSLDPRGVNDALTPVTFADGSDDFFAHAPFRGGFNGTVNWLAGWTASEAFGFTPSNYVDPNPGAGQPGVACTALLDVNGARNWNGSSVGDTSDPAGPHFTTVSQPAPLDLHMEAEPNSGVILLLATSLQVGAFPLGAFGQVDVTIPGIAIIADATMPGFFNSLFVTGSDCALDISLPTTGLPPGTVLPLQCLMFNSSTVFRLSNAVEVTVN